MPKKKKTWEPQTRFKSALSRLTDEWGSKKRLAGDVGVPVSSMSDWANPDEPALPNVEQAYFIARALEQDLMDMLGGEPQPRTERMAPDEQQLLAIYRKLPAAQKRILRQTAETFATAAGITPVPADSDKQEQAG